LGLYSSAWDYTIKFEIVNSGGSRHVWFDGDVTAGASDTSVAGTASVDDTSPSIVDGVGTVVLSGDAQNWLDTETATMTLSHTLNGNTVTADTFVVTFTA
jgi:hypothetical protein